jgi:diacylglycerol O-acyltransferase / wax synthase
LIRCRSSISMRCVAGARVASAFPVIPLADRHALSFGALSYDGGMHFSAYADPVLLPQATDLPSLLVASLTDLLEAGRHRPARDHVYT